MAQKRKSDNKNLTIASVNWSGIWGDKEANLGKMKTKIMEAADIGTDMIVFPELVLSGYECDEAVRQKHKPCSMHVALAETIPGPSTEDIGKLAKELGMYIIFGMPEIDIKHAEIIYNSVAVLGPEGLVGKYRKLYLPGLPMFTETICFKFSRSISATPSLTITSANSSIGFNLPSFRKIKLCFILFTDTS